MDCVVAARRRIPWRAWSGEVRPADHPEAGIMNLKCIKSARHPFRRLSLLIGAVLLAIGCDALTLDREPEVVHLELDSPDVSQVALIVSQWFIEVADPDCEDPGNPECLRTQLVEADTSMVSLPFRESYPLSFRLQFYAEAFTAPPVDATLAMKVHLDDEEWYNNSRRLSAMNGAQTLKFKYQYHNLKLPGG